MPGEKIPISGDSGDNSIVVKPSRLKAFGWFMICFGFAVPVTFHVFSHRGQVGPVHLAVPLVLLWAAAIFQLQTLLFPGASSFRLSPEGFTFGTVLGRRRYRWTGVRQFQMRRRRVKLFWSREVVAFSFSGDGAPQMRPDDPSWRSFEHEIPNIYQITPAALADLLNDYMRRVMGAADDEVPLAAFVRAYNERWSDRGGDDFPSD